MPFNLRLRALAILVFLGGLSVADPPTPAAETYILPTTAEPAVRPLRPLPLVEQSSGSTVLEPQSPAMVSAPAKPAAPKAEDEPLSTMEAFFARAPGLAGPPLRQFGYEMFGGIEGGAMVAETMVPPDYPLGPGDELAINAPMSTQELRAVVGRDGTIFIPNFGSLSVAGQTLESFQRALRARAKGVPILIRLGKLRSLTVYLAGRVKKPGSYTVNALSTVTTLLQAAGGVAKNGSLRRLHLRRRGASAVSFDFYDFLLKGQNAGNIRIESGDIIYVPTIGAQVAVAGAVRHPAIYELKAATTIEEALALAGGLLPQALTRQVLLQRVRPNVAREVRELDLGDPKTGTVKLQDGDLLHFSGVLDRVENGVVVEGHVERPGLYEIRPGVRVADVVGQRAEPKPETYLDHAQISRETGPDRHIEVIHFNLGRALGGEASNNLELRPRDVITVFSLKDFDYLPKASVFGAVLRPGAYRVYQNMHVSTLLNVAGGLLPEADGKEAELTRVMITDGRAHVERMTFSPGSALKGSEKDDFVIERGDSVLIKAVTDFRPVRVAEILGEVAKPGTYGLLDGERLSSLIARAGAFTSRAYLPAAILTRETVRIQQQQQISDLADRLDRSLVGEEGRPPGPDEDLTKRQNSLATRRDLTARLRRATATGRVVVRITDPDQMRDGPEDILLEDGDRLLIPPLNETVSVLGAVWAPNAFKHSPRFTVEDYLKLSGGATRQGDLGNVYVVRADGQVHSLQNYSEPFLFLFRQNLLGCHLNPGDTIIIPERIEFQDALVDIGRITQILAQSATTAGVLYGIFGK